MANNFEPLNDEEKQFIKEKSVLPEWTDKKIAETLNRSEEVVKKWRNKFGITKNMGGGLAVTDSKITKKNINKSNLSEEEKLGVWKKYFRTTLRYKRLQKQFLENDLEYFVESWCNYAMQLEDMKASEEEQLETLIIYKIRMGHNQENYKKGQLHEIELQNMMAGRTGEKELDLENENDRFIYEMLQSNNRLMAELNTQYKELSKEHDNALKALNATREQREQKEKIGADTFFSLVRLMNEQDKRAEMGRYNEYMKLASKKQTEKMKELHTFADGSLDRILLTSEQFEKKNDKGKQDEKS